MTAKQTGGALEQVIHSAVQAALAEYLKPMIDDFRRLPVPQARGAEMGVPVNPERFVSMTELCQRLGINRTTALRRERCGKLPRRRAFPDGRIGWSSKDVDEWFAGALIAQPDPERNARLAARIGAGSSSEQDHA